MVDDVSGQPDLPIHFTAGQATATCQQRPEVPVHHVGEARQIHIGPRGRMAGEDLQRCEHMGLSPGLDTPLHTGKFRIAESRLLRSTHYAIVFGALAKHRGEKLI